MSTRDLFLGLLILACVSALSAVGGATWGLGQNAESTERAIDDAEWAYAIAEDASGRLSGRLGIAERAFFVCILEADERLHETMGEFTEQEWAREFVVDR